MICSLLRSERGGARTTAAVYSLATAREPAARDAGGTVKSRAGAGSSAREINAIPAQCPNPSDARATGKRGVDGHESSTRLVPSIISSARMMLSTLFWGDKPAKNFSGGSDATQTVSVKKTAASKAAHTRLVFPPVGSSIKRPPPRSVFFT
ncbi:MAG: hypothetical protein LBE65_01730 [Synergistaceae bacterium]|nr:hypothetical protein [Synergistaceae bacterium]